MTYIANVTGDRTICVIADGGLEVASDVAGATPFRLPDGDLLTAVCDVALGALGFVRTEMWQPPAAQDGYWTAGVARGAPEKIFVTEAQAKAARMLVDRDRALGREPDPATLKIAEAVPAGESGDEGTSWAKIKRDQARGADELAAVASGIGEYGIANACYRLAAILRRQAEDREKGNQGK